MGSREQLSQVPESIVFRFCPTLLELRGLARPSLAFTRTELRDSHSQLSDLQKVLVYPVFSSHEFGLQRCGFRGCQLPIS